MIFIPNNYTVFELINEHLLSRLISSTDCSFKAIAFCQWGRDANELDSTKLFLVAYSKLGRGFRCSQ